MERPSSQPPESPLSVSVEGGLLLDMDEDDGMDDGNNQEEDQVRNTSDPTSATTTSHRAEANVADDSANLTMGDEVALMGPPPRPRSRPRNYWLQNSPRRRRNRGRSRGLSTASG